MVTADFIAGLPVDVAFQLLDREAPSPEGSAFEPGVAIRICELAEGRNPGYDAPLTPAQERALEACVTPEGPEGVRTAVVTSYDVGKAFYKTLMLLKFEGLAKLLWYGQKHPARGARNRMAKKGIDVEELARRWVDLIARLSTAHSADEMDEAEASLDEVLLPVLKCPVGQLREFYRRMVELLKEDSRIPLFVWRAFEMYAEKNVLTAPDEEVVELRTALAKEIADVVAPEVQKDIVEAMVNALQWRSSEKLTQIRDAVKEGARPRARRKLVGHESCLFLEVTGADGTPVATVQI